MKTYTVVSIHQAPNYTADMYIVKAKSAEDASKEARHVKGGFGPIVVFEGDCKMVRLFSPNDGY